MDLSRKRVRERLPLRKEPYWQRLAEGAYLGYYAPAQTWHARYRKRDGVDAKGKPKFKQEWKPLGEGIEFDEAKRRAEEWIAQFSGSPVRVTKRDTVRAALETYLADLKRHGRPEAAREAEGRFKLTVYKDPIGELRMEDATQDDFLEWRDRLMAGRQPRSVNRQVRAVVAGLNRARQLGHVGNPEAWSLKPLADDVEDDGETAVFLTPEQRRAVIQSAPQPLAEFLQALEYTGARPKEIAAVKAGDFDGAQLRVAHRKGRPPKLRVRFVVLGPEGVAFFTRQAKNKLPQAHLFTEDGETPWRRHQWGRQIKAAIAAANKHLKGKARIPVGASAYSFRHARISELLQIHGVDPLTVAQQCGTSLAMIEKAYLRFIPSAMREKLAQVREA